MNEVITIDKQFQFKTKVHEITTISIEHSYDIVGSNCEGEFVLSGDYRLHEVSINKEDFSFRIPFKTELRSNVNLDSVEVTINDFSYELNDEILDVHIDYLIKGEQSLIEFAEEADLDEFLQQNEAEIIDLSEEEIEGEPIIEEEPEVEDREVFVEEVEDREEIIEEEIVEEEIVEKRHHLKPMVEENKIDVANEHTIINSINSEECFVTYHVHTVMPSDTIESICSHYKINLNDLKRFNNFDELILNMKLIIPNEEDQ